MIERSFNLLSPAAGARMSRRARKRFWVGVCAAQGVVVMLAVAMAQWSAPTLAKAGPGESETISTMEKSLETAQAELAALGPALRVTNLVGKRPDWSILLQVLAEQITENVVLQSVQVHPTTDLSNDADPMAGARKDGFNVVIAGQALTQADVMNLALDLESLGLFEKVSLSDAARAPGENRQSIVFRIACTLRSGEDAQ